MKYLLTIMIISLLSCKKDSEQSNKYNPPPTVTSMQVSSEVVNGVAHPKFTITLTIPDTTAVKDFILFANNSLPCIIIQPKTGMYTLVDTYNSYPAAADKKTYSSAFIMADNSSIYSSSININ